MKKRAPLVAKALPAHSTLGASSSARWFACAGSVRLSQGIETKAGPAAEEGTAAHELAEKCLRSGKNARDLLGKVFNGFKVTEEMARAVQVYLDHVRKVVKETGGELLIEHKFHLKHLHPLLFGTGDVVIRVPFDRIIVMDYKHGMGYAVEVEENSQLLYYGVGGAYEEDGYGDYLKVELHVVQPRAQHQDGPIRKWELTFQKLVKWGQELKIRAIATQKKDAPLNPGEHCRWCPAAGICPALHSTAVATAKADFAEVNPKLPQVERLTEEQVARVIQHADMLRKWLDSVENYALMKFERGEQIEGLKLVRGRGRREWKNEDEAAKILKKKLGAQAYRHSLLSPSQAEELLGKGALSDFIETREGGLGVVHGSKRGRSVNLNDEIKEDEW